MRPVKPLLLFPTLLLVTLPLAAQHAMVSLIRQPRATAAEFTVPITEIQLKDQGDLSRLHLGIGLGARHWDDGDNALRFVADANATVKEFFVGFGAVVFTIRSFVWCETCPVASIAFIWSYLCAE